MLKIGRLYLDEGRWQGRQLISPLGQGVDQEPAHAGAGRCRWPYGYLWWLGDIESHTYFAAMGSYGQNIIVLPNDRLVLVTVSDESGSDTPSDEFNNTLIEVILRPILGSR